MEDSPPPVPIHAASQAATDLQSVNTIYIYI